VIVGWGFTSLGRQAPEFLAITQDERSNAADEGS